MDNTRKLLWYISPLSVDPIEFDGNIIDKPVDKIQLNATFFKKDDCKLCGICCIPEDNCYTQFEYEKIMACKDEVLLEYDPPLPVDYLHELQQNVKKVEHTINGKAVPIYTFKGKFKEYYVPFKGKNKVQCHFLHERDDGRRCCGIHPVRSITCRVPHLRMFHNNKGSVSFGISPYGRNWAIGCPANFTDPINEEEFSEVKAERLGTFEYLNDVANDMNIPTHIPKIIEFIKKAEFDNYSKYLYINIIDDNTEPKETKSNRNHSKVKNIFGILD